MRYWSSCIQKTDQITLFLATSDPDVRGNPCFGKDAIFIEANEKAPLPAEEGFFMPSYKRLAVLSHGPVLLGELLSQHGQLGFCPCDGLFIVFNASPGQTEVGFGFFDLLVDGVHVV